MRFQRQEKVGKIDRLQICLVQCELLNDADQIPTLDRRQSEDTLIRVTNSWVWWIVVSYCRD